MPTPATGKLKKLPTSRSIQVNFQGMLAGSPDQIITYDTDGRHAGGEQFSNKKEDIWGNENKGMWE